MRVRADAFDTRKVLDLRYLDTLPSLGHCCDTPWTINDASNCGSSLTFGKQKTEKSRVQQKQQRTCYTFTSRRARGVMEEQRFFVSADEAEEEREGLGRDAFRPRFRRDAVRDDKPGGVSSWDGRVPEFDAFEDAADDSFADPIDTSAAVGASSGGEFVSGTDTDGGGGRRGGRGGTSMTMMPSSSSFEKKTTFSRARASRPGATTSRAISNPFTARADAQHHNRKEVAIGIGDTLSTQEPVTTLHTEPTSRTQKLSTAADIAAAAFASANLGDSDSDGGYASAGNDDNGNNSNADDPNETSVMTTTSELIDDSLINDDSFMDSVQEPEVETVTQKQMKPSTSGPPTPSGPHIGGNYSQTRHTQLDKHRPPPLSPPSPLAPGTSRPRFASAPEQYRADPITTPTSVPVRRASSAAVETKSLERATVWGVDTAPRTARSQRAEALLRDARKGSSDDATTSSGSDGERVGTQNPEHKTNDARLNAHITLSRGSSNASSVHVDTPFSPGSSVHSPYSEDDTRGLRRASRRRAQREKYMLKLREGFADEAWMSAEETRRAASAMRRNAHSEPDRRIVSASMSGSVGSDDGSMGKQSQMGQLRGSATGGERFGSSRSDARRNAAVEEAALNNFRRSVLNSSPGTSNQQIPFLGDMGMTPGMGIGMSPNVAFPGMPGISPGMQVPTPDHVMWQLQQQQQMVQLQMQQLQIAQQQQQRNLMAGANVSTAAMNSAAQTAYASQNGQHDSPERLFQAIARNDVDEVCRIVDSGQVPVDQADGNGNTLLMQTCHFGHRRLTKHLLKKGASVNKKNFQGNTPLHFCLAGNFGELGAYLVGKGADEGAENAKGKTPYEGL